MLKVIAGLLCILDHGGPQNGPQYAIIRIIGTPMRRWNPPFLRDHFAAATQVSKLGVRGLGKAIAERFLLRSLNPKPRALVSWEDFTCLACGGVMENNVETAPKGSCNYIMVEGSGFRALGLGFRLGMRCRRGP